MYTASVAPSFQRAGRQISVPLGLPCTAMLAKTTVQHNTEATITGTTPWLTTMPVATSQQQAF